MNIYRLDRPQTRFVPQPLDQLLDDRALLPVFQPIHKTSGLTVHGYEFLARSEIAGVNSPHEMFSLAERCGSKTVGLLSTLCREVAVEFADKLNLSAPIFLNMHPLEELNHDVVPQLVQLRKRYRKLPLVLELHEHARLSPRSISSLKECLTRLEIKLALDDIGSGNDRLRAICQSSVDYVKLCRGFTGHTSDTSTLNTLVTFIKSSGAAVVAEGIETDAELDLCRACEIDFVQGYYLSKPKQFSANCIATTS